MKNTKLFLMMFVTVCCISLGGCQPQSSNNNSNCCASCKTCYDCSDSADFTQSCRSRPAKNN